MSQTRRCGDMSGVTADSEEAAILVSYTYCTLAIFYSRNYGTHCKIAQETKNSNDQRKFREMTCLLCLIHGEGLECPPTNHPPLNSDGYSISSAPSDTEIVSVFVGIRHKMHQSTVW